MNLAVLHVFNDLHVNNVRHVPQVICQLKAFCQSMDKNILY